MILGLGTDLVEVERFRLALERRATLAERLFTDGEREYAYAQHDPGREPGGPLRAKEAVMKALGVGLGTFAFRDVEVRAAPTAARRRSRCTGKARSIAEAARRRVRGSCRSRTPTPWRWRSSIALG